MSFSGWIVHLQDGRRNAGRGPESAFRGSYFLPSRLTPCQVEDGNPSVVLAWLANELRQLDVALKSGGAVTTGTCHSPLPIRSGDIFEADFGMFDKVSVVLAQAIEPLGNSRISPPLHLR